MKGNRKDTHRVGLDSDAARLDVLDQPGPSGALDAGEGGVEVLLERLEIAVGVLNRLCKSTGRRLASALGLRCQVLPEEGVVEVATAVEVDQGGQGDGGGDVTALLGRRHLLGGVVVGIDIGLVMLRVVKLHDLARDRRLEGAKVV